jgi:hypothetical protein
MSQCTFATVKLQRMRIVCCLCSAVLLLGAGCSERRTDAPSWPVEGRVSFNGAPPVGAQVVFHPTGQSAGTVRPTGQVDKTGQFTLTTYTANDGAPAGDYDVTVEWWVSKHDQLAVNQLPARYQQPKRSGLHARVTAGGANALPTFKLAR